jgi:hypothetical protein
MIKNMLQFDPDWCASTLLLDSNKTTIKKHSIIFLIFNIKNVRSSTWNSLL